MGGTMDDPARVRGWSRRLWFASITVVLSLLVIELASRFLENAASRLRDPAGEYIAPDHVVPIFELGASRKGRLIYMRTRHHWIRQDVRFRAQKGPDTFRVFCLGGSAAQGWPHETVDTYPALLQRKLRRLLPDRRIEVVDVAGNSYASQRVKAVFDEIISYDPDLILIYTGNNEFLEEGISRSRPRIASPWRHSAALRILHGSLLRQGETFDGDHGTAATTSARAQYALAVASGGRRQPEMCQTIRSRYSDNITTMARTARARGVDLMLLTVPVNLVDWKPNVSAHRLAGPEREAWMVSYREGVVALEEDRAADAARSLHAAVALDKEHAASWYYLGRALRRIGRYPEALAAFEAAVEHDALPSRSIFDDDLRVVARSEGVPIVDLVGLFARHSPGGLVGFDQFVDYVHPTPASNERIAHEIVKRLAERQMLPEPIGSSDVAATRIRISPNAGENLFALSRLYSQFLVMRQYDTTGAIASRFKAAIARAQALHDSEGKLDALVARIDLTQEVLDRYRMLLRSEEIGTLDQDFTPTQANIIRHNYAVMMQRNATHERFDFEIDIPRRRGQSK